MNKARLTASTFLVWLGARLAPKPMDRLFCCYVEMMQGFQDQMVRGRTYGVVAAPWWTDEEKRGHALQMSNAAMNALYDKRQQLEDTNGHR